MVNYILNGTEVPAFPTVDTSTYPYAVVLDISSRKTEDFNYDYELIFVSTPPIYGSFIFNGQSIEAVAFESTASVVGYACKSNSISWTKISLTADEQNTASYLFIEDSVYVWSSVDVVNINTGVVQYETIDIIQHVFAATPTYSSNYNSSEKYKYAQGNIAGTLRISAYRADTGVLTYQWYLVGETSDTPIDGATSHLFTPSTDEVGTYQYYCIVTNTYEEYTAQTVTNIATVIITALNKALKNLDQQSASLGWIIGKVLQHILSMDSEADDATLLNGVLHIFNGDATLTDINLEVR